MNKMRITYFFDVISPYSCLSWKVLQRYKQRWGFELELKPMFLGGVMMSVGNKPPSTLPQKGMFLDGDLARSRDFYNVPILPTPNNFFSEVARAIITCQRLIVATQLSGASADKVEALVDALTDAVHVEVTFRSDDNDLTVDQALLSACLQKSGFTEDMLKQLGNSDVKAQLKANTEEAVAAGAFGSPYFIVQGGREPFAEPFTVFGSDRFEQIAFVCGKDWQGPDPTRPKL